MRSFFSEGERYGDRHSSSALANSSTSGPAMTGAGSKRLAATFIVYDGLDCLFAGVSKSSSFAWWQGLFSTRELRLARAKGFYRCRSRKMQISELIHLNLELLISRMRRGLLGS
jgi:hypothetical protein